MKNLPGFFSVLLFSAVLFCATTSAQDMNNPDAQKIWSEYMTPGSGHEVLALHAGEWKATTKMWMDTSSEPQVFEGKSKNEMIMGGRYLKSVYTGNMMGMPFEGMSVEGFDNAKKIYTSVWVDSFGTGTAISTGKYDEKTKSITYLGSVYEPVSGKDQPMREVIKTIDKDHHVIEMYNTINGKEYKSMEISFERIN